MQQSVTDHLKFVGPEAELRHASTPDPLWQESVVLHWYDANSGVGGFHRIGHEPNQSGGTAVAWSMLFDRAGFRYKRDTELPLTTHDRPDKGFAAGSLLRFIYDNHARWDVAERDLSLTLECRDFVRPIDTTADMAKELAQGHFETMGRVAGTLRRSKVETTIAGLGWRDHSWGPRDWHHSVLNHRWITGSFGPQMSFCALLVQDARGEFHPSGFTVEDGRVRQTRKFDVWISMAPDGLTHRGGELVFHWADTKSTEIQFLALDGAIFSRGTIAAVDILCEAEWNGIKGYCNAEISTNPRLGTGPLKRAINANLQEGFSTSTSLHRGER